MYVWTFGQAQSDHKSFTPRLLQPLSNHLCQTPFLSAATAAAAVAHQAAVEAAAEALNEAHGIVFHSSQLVFHSTANHQICK